jgi:sugar transferase (PEP-CTERM system associated)
MIRLFRHYIPGWFLPLALIETIIFGASIYFGVFLRGTIYFGPSISLDDSGFVEGPFLPKAVVFAMVMQLCMFAAGLYQRNLREGIHGMELRVAINLLAGSLIMSLIFYIFPSMFLGRGVMALAFISALVGIVLVRIIAFNITDVDVLKRRILVLGTGDKASEIEQMETQADEPGFCVVGYVPVGNGDHRVAQGKILLPCASLMSLAEQHHVDEFVVATSERRNTLPVKEILQARMNGIDVIDLLGFFERYTGKIRLGDLQPSWLIFSDGFRQGFFRNFGKRLFDIAAAIVLLIVASPVIVMTALAIFIESRGRGSIIYRQVRVGERGRPFELLKFRSMREDAEENGVPQWAQKDDDRITFVGKFIRRNRVDELPQILNVLRGDMSFVGPRPERPEFVDKLSQMIPFYNERHRVKPGITGWAQISYPYGSSEEDAFEKMQYDLYYVKNHSWFLDLMILMQTIEVVLWGKGA